MEKDIGNFLSKAWNKFEEVEELPSVKRIAENFPILWFGDMDAYLCSETRVITVGLNPSNMEFSKPRFFTYADKRAVPLTKVHWENAEHEKIAWAYSNYFHINPFGAYFNCYEKALRCLRCNVSYAGEELGDPNAKNTAIHIDLKSPIATNPTWSKLSPWEKKVLTCDLFGGLISYLRPDMVLFSTGKWDFIAEIGLGKPLFSYPASFDDNNLLELYQKDGADYIWGRPNVNPFMMIPKSDWDTAFSNLRNILSK